MPSFEGSPPTKSPEALGENNEPYDAVLYEKFLAAGGRVEAYELLQGDPIYRDEQKKIFLASKTDNPKLDYPLLDDEYVREQNARAEAEGRPERLLTLDEREKSLLRFKNQLLTQNLSQERDLDKAELVQQLYRWKVNEKIATVRMLKAAHDGDMRKFRHYNYYIYGAPEKDIFAYTVRRLKEQIEECNSSENEEIKKAAKDLESVLPEDVPTTQAYQLPSPEIHQQIKEFTQQELGFLINLPPGKEQLETAEVQQAMEYALRTAGLKGWQVVADQRDNMMVSHVDQTVYIPQGRTWLAQRVGELIAHEIGIHVQLAEKGKRSKLMLLGEGLDRFDDTEGLTGMAEQGLREKLDEYSGLEPHLAVSLAFGIEEEKDGQRQVYSPRRDFRGVYEVMKKYYLLKDLLEREESRQSGRPYLKEGSPEEVAASEAWKRCVRTFRGSDCETSGTSLNKDIIYGRGNVLMYEVLNRDGDLMKKVMIGKYAPYRLRHVLILNMISDGDLETLARK